jgi:S-DNA-T family DNA segregation ATPase FtsK/SpoIIIE
MGRRRHRQRGRGDFSAFNIRRWIPFSFEMSPDTKHGIFIICLFVLGVIGLLGLFNLSGYFGELVVHFLSLLLGDLKWVLPVLLLLMGYFLLRTDLYRVKAINYIGALLLLIGITGLWHMRLEPELAIETAQAGLGGGFLGLVLSVPLTKVLGLWGSIVVCFAVFLVGVLLTFETSLYGLMWPIRLLTTGFTWIGRGFAILGGYIAAWRQQRAVAGEEEYEEEVDQEPNEEEIDDTVDVDEGTAETPQFRQAPIHDVPPAMESAMLATKPKKFGKKIELPLTLLTSRSGKPTSGDIKNNQEIIRRTLINFGIKVEMSTVNIGPTVTQYTLRPADGVRLSKIINLNSDLALALAAHPIRIEAPIPGKSLVGVEIPNQVAAKVTMHDLLSSPEFQKRSNNLMIALGKDVSGNPYFAQLDRMPHLLIAGSTGSGKSVCVNSIIVSLLYQNSPDELKFILVDPKRVELPAYNAIPYLLTPVITDVKKTISALKWAVVEMERRFEVLSKAGKRNIESYNQTASDKMPYIVFIIDELADLMATASNDVEAGIVRLAQMARAVGIHLILATQRPSVEVITGLIKANIPARIAFSVASLIDSRTILDASGAEKLVGRGDMLYLGPDVSKPKRLQGVYLSDQEIHSTIGYIKDQGDAQYIEEIGGSGAPGAAGGSFGSNDDGDSMLGEAKEVIRQSGKASASLLQRRLKVGYARAARILDLLEEQGIVGPADGAKPREVYLERLGQVSNVVAFAAAEHDLEGELRDIDVEEDDAAIELNEPEPLVVLKEEMSETVITEDGEDVDKGSDEELPPDFLSGDDKTDEDTAKELESMAEDMIEVDETDEEELEHPEKPKKKSPQKVVRDADFAEDEWT